MNAQHSSRERGQILVLFALSLVAIIGMVGLVLDSGGAFAQRRTQQNAADVAALAAANDLIANQGDADWIGTAESIALWFKSIGHESWFYWYLTGCIAVSLLVYLAMRDTRTSSAMDRHE